MKKPTRKQITAAGIIAALSASMPCLTSCNNQANVPDSPGSYDPSQNEPVDVYGPPGRGDGFNEEMNEPISLYGPPEYFEELGEEGNSEDSSDETNTPDEQQGSDDEHRAGQDGTSE